MGPTDPVAQAVRGTREIAAQTAGSRSVRGISRWGLACRGVVYVLVGYLAARIAVGAAGAPSAGPDQPADAQGAVQELAGSPFGRVTLWFLAVGLTGYAISQLVEVLYRGREKESFAGRWSQRLVSAWGVLIYAAFTVSTVSLLLGDRRPASQASSAHQDTALTARLLRTPPGRPLLALVGVALLLTSLEMARRAVQLNFRERFDEATLPRLVGRSARVLGSFGCWARAAVFALVGALLVRAAVIVSPADAKGLDASLRTLARSAYGPLLLGVVAAGLVSYGLYCGIEARYRRLPRPDRPAS